MTQLVSGNNRKFSEKTPLQSSISHEGKAPQGKTSKVFLLFTLKTTFQQQNLTIDEHN